MIKVIGLLVLELNLLKNFSWNLFISENILIEQIQFIISTGNPEVITSSITITVATHTQYSKMFFYPKINILREGNPPENPERLLKKINLDS